MEHVWNIYSASLDLDRLVLIFREVGMSADRLDGNKIELVVYVPKPPTSFVAVWFRMTQRIGVESKYLV
jgi:hypothetical protein